MTTIYNSIPSPIDCAVTSLPFPSMLPFVRNLPLHPRGSLWVLLYDLRAKDGGLRLIPERLTMTLVDDGWILADKIQLVVTAPTPPGVLTGSRVRRYFGSSGTWLRFTRVGPKEANANMAGNNVWDRTLEEDESWYMPVLAATCPENGFVVDIGYNNVYVKTAAAKLGLRFAGIDVNNNCCYIGEKT